MSFPLVFHPAVQAEVDDTYQWYEQQRTGLGNEFLEALEAVYGRLQATPQMHRILQRDIRRALLRRFPFAVYYRFHGDRVEVIAVQHQRRDPKAWQSRN